MLDGRLVNFNYVCSSDMKNDRLTQLIGFLSESPADPFVKYALATEYLKSGNTDQALRYYEDLRTNHADYVGTYYHLGKLYEALGKPDEAISAYEQGMQVAKDKRDMHALSELQAAYQAAAGFDEEDDDD
ncbi:Tetratricopeptide repeat-containing protein [Parapedobacter composti]|uniref:Tetratricopeptide repeat-containing protein n=2 Tax=Parapedobacter composti TaxID=623281 RepID=A0A1I1GEL5_9SPHI|nr:Tetratricopeptide repeat-containing protein [Parapedobacter composti]